jgi:hypothetical protein
LSKALSNVRLHRGLVGGFGAVVVGLGVAARPAAAAGGWSAVPVPAPNGGNDYLSSVAASGESDAWAVGQQFIPPDANGISSRMLAWHWNGTQWTRTTTPAVPNNVGVAAVSASSTSDAWAVGKNVVAGYSAGIPLAVHWNGTAWSVAANAVGATTGSLTGVATLSPSNAWAAGTIGKYNQLVQHWDGSAWSVAAVPNPTPADPAAVTKLAAISARNASDVWALGTLINGSGEALYALHFDGVSWTSSLIQQPVYGQPLRPAAIAAAGPNDVWAIGNSSVSEQPVVFHWNGTAWSVSAIPNLGDYPTLTGFAVRGSNDVWASGNLLVDVTTPTPHRRTQSLHWNGTAWSIVPTVTTEAFLNGAAAVPGSSRVWMVADTGLILTRTS